MQRRVQLGLNAYAQVPLLNDKQVVASWREILPRLADADVRRIPIEVTQPGVYLVEAVTGTQLAYTILMVSDVALVTKVAPGTMLAYLVDRAKGQPVAGCSVAAIADKVALGTGDAPTRAGSRRMPLGDVTADDLITVARCGDQAVASTPPTYGAAGQRALANWSRTSSPTGPSTAPGTSVKAKAILRWRTGTALEAFDQPAVEMTRHRSDRTRDPSRAPRRRRVRRRRHRGDAAGGRRARRLHASTSSSGEREGHRVVRGAGVPQARVRGQRHARRRRWHVRARRSR